FFVEFFGSESPGFAEAIDTQIFKPHRSSKKSGECAATRAAGVNHRRRASSEDVEQFHIKNQGGVGRDTGTCAALTIGQVVGNVETPLGTHWHELQGFGPTGNHAIHGKVDGLAAIVRSEEHT